MSQIPTTSHSAHFNRQQKHRANLVDCSVNNHIHVPPLPSQSLRSNYYQPSAFRNPDMSTFINLHQQQNEIRLLSAPPSSITMTPSNDNDPTSSILNISKTLYQNLSLAKQRLMVDLKESSEPSDIALYTQLENTTLDNTSSSSKINTSSLSSTAAASAKILATTVINKTVGNRRKLLSHNIRYTSKSAKTLNNHRVHKKKPYHSSYMELQANENGFVSIVLQKKSAASSKGSFATLARSYSFNLSGDSDYDSDSESDSDSDSHPENDMDDEIQDDGSTDKIDEDSYIPPATPGLDLSCDDDTDVGESMSSTDQSLSTASNGTTTATPTIAYTQDSIDWISPSFTTNIGFNTNEQGIGMEWNMDMAVNMDMMATTSPTWIEAMEYVIQQDNNQIENIPLDQQLDENEIVAWLQRGGSGSGPLVAATDQELADLVDFD